jgi:site-specific recombinase XerD
MIDSVFLFEGDRAKHREAPLFLERERYLTYLFEIGTRRERVRNVATMLLHVVRLLELESPRPVGMDEILQGCQRWVGDSNALQHRSSSEASSYTFQVVATNWLRFQGSLIAAPKPVPLFDNLLSEFLNDMRSQRGLALETLRTYRSQILAFLNWLQSRCPEFSNVRGLDIEEYLEAKRSDGWSRSTVAAHCRSLRTFFGYAEQRRWCSSGIRGCISSPRVPRIAENLSVPPWHDVRRVIASIGNLRAADLRAKTMFLLFSIYGLRSAEVRGLMLEDIDWRRGSLTVRRAKRGKIQQFPLQSEVGEAIAMYLQKARPKCSCRNLFVTLRPPHRPVLGHTMSTIICPRIKKLGITTEHFGPHMLRRACATQLLRIGSSLEEIADFLGHSDLRSVSSYARFDSASLKIVANFSLRGVL